jgi:hypothetical protein
MSFALAELTRTICRRCDVIDAALKWADRGFAVFPLVPRCKKPLGSLVPHGLKEASRDHAVIRNWWRREPKANIGIVTGAGNFVVDLDDAEAVSWFANACGRHGAPKTLTTRTSRGFHVFFACGAEVPNSAGRLAPGVDVRGEGGYVVAAPSTHPGGAVYTVARDLPIAEAPQWLVDKAMPREVPVVAAPARHEDHSQRALRSVEGIVRAVASAGQGERNVLAFWGACRMRERVADGLLTAGLAQEILAEAAQRTGLPAWEIKTAINSAFRGGCRG